MPYTFTSSEISSLRAKLAANQYFEAYSFIANRLITEDWTSPNFIDTST
jgi:hypothetical protein